MGEMTMPGGWTMSTMWMRMPGQTWASAATSFLGMWIVMMMAMMLPVLIPMLSNVRPGRLTTIAAAGYFFVWTVVGIAAFPLGAGLAALEMQHPALARTVPMVAGVIVLIAGSFQFTARKARYLACCREGSRRRTLAANPVAARRHGARLGLLCSRSCANLMTILLSVGLMDLRAMAVVTAAITFERLVPGGDERVARVVGAVAVGAGATAIAQAVGLG